MTRFVFAAAIVSTLTFTGTAFAQSAAPIQSSWTGSPAWPAVDPLEPLADAFPAIAATPTPASRAYFVASGFWRQPNRVLIDVRDRRTVVVVPPETHVPVVEAARTAAFVYRTLLEAREAQARTALAHGFEIRLLTDRLK